MVAGSLFWGQDFPKPPINPKPYTLNAKPYTLDPKHINVGLLILCGVGEG